ncbi:50S ribosomal protein L32 [Candidatus Gracilibacteria bacterium]|nr:50S ribosomal protein L32 [Candidatus Gracilibacteria bacterium]
MTFSKKSLSRVRGRKRYAAWLRLNAERLENQVSLQYDKSGQAIGRAHFASPVTGEYNGRKVLKIKSKSKQAKLIRA